MQTNPRPSRKIAEAMMAAAERRHSIWNSLYAAVLGLVPDEREHLGYEDVILTREAPRTPMHEACAQHYDWLMGREVQS